MVVDVRFGVLGAIEVTGPNGPVAVGGPKERAVLAALLLRAGSVVSSVQLATDLWGESPPRSAAKTIQTYVSHLRRALPAVDIETTGAGYRLVTAPEGIDARRFETLLRDAQRARKEQRPDEARSRLDEALGLWRGDPLAEIRDCAFALVEAVRLDELRLEALEERVQADLDLGEPDAAVAELQGLVRAQPTHERYWGLLMVALYRCGRQADALKVFQEARRSLIESAGVEPGEELRQLEAAVLRQDASLDGPPAPPAASGGAIIAGTRTVTLVLTDIDGSTRLWELDPPGMASAVAALEGAASSLALASGGALVKARGEGDSTFSVFDRASDAVRFALALQLELVDLARPGGEELLVRVAVHTGEVQHRDGDFYGRAVNRAARLRALAPGGVTLLSATTAGLVGDDLPEGTQLVDLGEHELRDLTRAERVFGLAHDRLRPPETSGGSLRLTLPSALDRTGAPLIGRAEALGRLRSAWERSTAGLGVALLGGEPGIGKTRLAAALAADVYAAGATVLFGRCDEDVLTPYQPFVEALDRAVSQLPTPTLRRVVGPDREVLAPLLPRLADRLGQVDGGQRDRWALFEAVTGVVGRLSTVAPVLLIVDDLHWADEPSLALLRHVVRAVADRPVLLVGTYRTTELGRHRPLAAVLADLADAPVERIDLGRLAEAEVAEIMASVSAGDGPSQARSVHHATGGNPFFVVEVARHLAETSGAGGPLPESVKQVVGSRVSRLGDDVGALLAASAVAGITFELPVVAAVAGLDDRAAEAAAEAAVSARLLRETGPGRFAFDHAIVRDVLDGELSSTRRARFHREVAVQLEERHRHELATVAAELASHWAASGEHAADGPTVRFSDLAADAAASVFAWEEAIAHRRRALELVQAAGDRGRACVLRISIGHHLLWIGEVDEGKRELAVAIDLAIDLDDPRLHAEAALIAGLTGDDWVPTGDAEGRERFRHPGAPSQRLFDRAIAELDPGDSLRSRLLARIGISDTRGDGVRLSAEAWAAIQGSDDPDALGWAVAYCYPMLGPTVISADECLALARAGGSTAVPLPFRLNFAAVALVEEGRLDEADELLSAIRERSADRVPAAMATATYLQAAIAACRGDLDRARLLGQEAGQSLVAAGDPKLAIALLALEGGIAMIEGDLPRIRPALEALAQSEIPIVVARAGCALARWLDGSTDEAAELLGVLVAELDGELSWPQIAVAAMLARVAGEAGDREACEVLSRVLRPHARFVVSSAGWVVFPVTVAHGLGLMARATGDIEQAVADFTTSIERCRAAGCEPLAAESEMELARTLLHRGAPGDRRQALELLPAALATADRIGMARVRALGVQALAEATRPALPHRLRRPEPMAGRAAELEALRDAVEAGTRLTFVSGEPGIGKTRLCAELAHHLDEQGWPVLYGHCTDDGLLPFQPYVEVLRSILAVTGAEGTDGALGRLLPEVATDDAPLVEGELERLRIFDAVVGALGRFATRPTMIVIDDLHWADRATLLLLERIVSDDVLAHLRVVTTYRDTDLGRDLPLAASLPQLRAATPTARVDLGGLDVDAVAELLGRRLGPEVDDEVVARVHRESDGNALFAVLVADHLGDARSAAGDVPQGVREVVGKRLDRLPEVAQQLLAFAAVAGQEFHLSVVASAAGLDADVALAHIERAAGLGLLVEVPDVLDRFRFVHAVVQAALTAELSASRRARTHAAVAAALERQVAGPAEVAHHLFEAGAAGDPAHAIELARAAARTAVWQVAYEDAVGWLERALELLEHFPAESVELQAVILVELADAHYRIGSHQRSQELGVRAAELAREAGSSELLARAALSFSGAIIRMPGVDTRRWEIFDEVIEAADALPSVLRARLLARKASADAMLLDEEALDATGEQALRTAIETGDPWLVVDVQTYAAMRPAVWRSAEALRSDAAALADVAQRTGDGWAHAGARYAQLMAHLHLGEGAAARAAWSSFHELVAPLGILFADNLDLLLEATWAMGEGRFADADAANHRSLETYYLLENPTAAIAVAGAQTATLRWLRGDVGDLADALDVQTYRVWRTAAALARAALGDHDGARARLAQAIDRSAPLPRLMEWSVQVALLAELAVALDDRDLSEWLAPQVEPHVDRGATFVGYLYFGSHAHHLGLLESVLGDHEQAVVHLRQGLAVHEDLGLRAFVVKSQRALADVLEAQADPAAENTRTEAETEATALGMA